MGGLLPDFLFVLLQPQDLGGGPGGQNGHLAGDLVAGGGVHLGCDVFALLVGTLVHPGNGGAERLAVLAQNDQGFSLAGQADGAGFVGLDDTGGNMLGQHLQQIAGILLGIKLDPGSCPVINHGGAGGSAQLQFLVVYCGFDVGGSQINGNQFHNSSPMVWK